MENQKSKKTLVIPAISILIIVLIVAVLILGLGKKEKNEAEKCQNDYCCYNNTYDCCYYRNYIWYYRYHIFAKIPYHTC